MNVVYHSSDTFVPVLGVSVASLLENNKAAASIDIYVIENKISKENKEKLQRLVKQYGRAIHFIPMPDVNEKEKLGLRKIDKRWFFDSYCRLFLDKYLPEGVDRVLYLDGDTIVTESLEELWNYDLQGKCAGAVIEEFSKSYCSLLGLNEDAVFCNSGVILMNLKRWREAGIDERVRKCVREHNGYVFFMEMGVFNSEMQDEITVLPARYNVRTEMLMLKYKEVLLLRKPVRWYPEDEILHAVQSPAIVHMTSLWNVYNRAWSEVTNHPAKELYRHYKALTEWRDEPNTPDKRSNVKRVIDTVIEHTPNALLLPAVSYVYNHMRIWKIKGEMRKLQ